MASLTQNGYPCAHEYTVQFTCFKCPNYISVLHEIFICSDVVSQVFLAPAFLDRSVHRHVAPAPAQCAGAGGWGEALPCSGNQLLQGHLPSAHPPTSQGWGLRVYGLVPTFPGIGAAADGGMSSMQDHGLSTVTPAPAAFWLCGTVSLTPVIFSASCHFLSSSSLTVPPSPKPEGLDQASTIEKINTFSLFIHCSVVYLHCLCVTVKSYLLSLTQNNIFTRSSLIMLCSLSVYAGK